MVEVEDEKESAKAVLQSAKRHGGLTFIILSEPDIEIHSPRDAVEAKTSFKGGFRLYQKEAILTMYVE